jgi:PAS domain S-box-containing protein
MNGSIRTKLLALCIGLVLLTTTGIAVTYYRLTRQEKHRESQQRIQDAFDLLLDDLARQHAATIRRVTEFVQRENLIFWTPHLYNQDKSQILSVRFITSFLTSAATKLKEFGPQIAADQVRLYGANKRLLLVYRRKAGRAAVGGYVVTEKGNDAYLALDDPSQVSSSLVLDQHPVPEAPLPEGIAAYYPGDIPQTIRVETISAGRRLGYRVVAPITGHDVSTAGVLVAEIFYPQELVENYESLSKTAVNLFGGTRFSVGTLPVQTTLPPDVWPRLNACEQLLHARSAVRVMSLTLDNQAYYQGGCVFTRAGKLVGAITVSFSQAREQAEIRKILTAVFTISIVGILISVALISWIVVPTFTRPIITLKQVALKMAAGDLQHAIDTSGTDELGSLARSFAHMRDEIQKKQQALQRFTEALEQRVEKRTAEITRQKYILDTFMANVPDSIYFKDRDSRITRVNQAHAHWIGLDDPSREVGKTDFDLMPAELAQVRYEQEQEIIRAGQPLLALEEPDGKGNWWLTTKMPLRDEHGEIIGTYGISRDITPLKRTEEALKFAKEAAEEAQKAAEAANRAKSEFLANMSHELRTPLNVILGFTQIMARNPQIPADERDNLAIIRRSGEHLLRLINNVLDLSKIEANRIVYQPTALDLCGLLDELEEMFSLRTVQKHLALTVDRAADVPRYIRTDEVKLRQVLINLLNNAVKFTEIGKVEVRVAGSEVRGAGCEVRGDQSQIQNLQFEIEDTGPGIGPEELDLLFEAFQQTQTGRQTQTGTGLGLAISQRFVQVMGGAIDVRSTVGRGTTFTLTIPVEIVSAAEAPTPSPNRQVIALEPGQPRYRILVVDDQPESRRLLVKLLSPLGFDVREAADGRAAIAEWEVFAPHLIWMDLRMPGLDGYAAAARIIAQSREQDAHNQPKIIALTASQLEAAQPPLLSAGFDDLIRKPVRETEIFELLHKHLGVRYVYGEPGRRMSERPGFELTPEALAALPDAVRTQLQTAVNAADPEQMKHLIAQMNGRRPALAHALHTLVKQYRFDILQAVFEKA